MPEPTIPQRDPTQTVRIRRQFESEFARRVRAARGIIRTAVYNGTAPALTDKAGFARFVEAVYHRELVASRWYEKYIRQGYEHGIAHTTRDIIRAGGGPVFDKRMFKNEFRYAEFLAKSGPFQADITRLNDAARVLFEKQIEATGNAIQTGLKTRDKRKALNAVTEKTKNVLEKRGKMTTKTEVVKSHAEATLTTAKQAGLTDVYLEAEFVTAQDGHVCAECDALAGIYAIEEARGLIPVHPRCRCSWRIRRETIRRNMRIHTGRMPRLQSPYRAANRNRR